MSNIIEVKNLVKNYKDVHAVNDISFTVEEGSFFAFLGINGAGKSTTINILCTVLEKTSGNVKIGGYDLDKEKNKIKELIGIVFQGSVLDKQLNVKENLESRASYYGLNKKEIAKRIESLTQTFDLSEILKRKYGTLSGASADGLTLQGHLLTDRSSCSLTNRQRDLTRKQGCRCGKSSTIFVKKQDLRYSSQPTIWKKLLTATMW